MISITKHIQKKIINDIHSILFTIFYIILYIVSIAQYILLYNTNDHDQQFPIMYDLCCLYIFFDLFT